MELIFSCSSQDTEFTELVKQTFSCYGTVTETKVKGITGYETTMMILQIAAVAAATVIPFIIAHMTNNKNDRVKSKRCLIDNQNKTVSLEGYDGETVAKIVEAVIQK